VSLLRGDVFGGQAQLQQLVPLGERGERADTASEAANVSASEYATASAATLAVFDSACQALMYALVYRMEDILKAGGRYLRELFSSSFFGGWLDGPCVAAREVGGGRISVRRRRRARTRNTNVEAHNT